MTSEQHDDGHRQEQNRQVAISRLRMNLAIEIRQPLEGRDMPSELWASRCRGGRISVSPNHEDCPALVAEALDVLAIEGFDTKAVADLLSVTTSQLTKFLKNEPRAMMLVNQRRGEIGLNALR